MTKQLRLPIFVIFLVLFIDQATKIWVKTHMHLGESSFYNWDWWKLEWFQIYFTENPGMAFGWELEWEWGKLTLSLFRIIACIGIAWYIYHLTKIKAHKGLIVSIALIFAGAFGNIIDSAFYGLIFGSSGYTPADVAQFMPAEGGYQTFLHGNVVDMLYFPLIKGQYPEWFPFWGGESFLFFRPIFNIADSSITVGVVLIILFQNRFFPQTKKVAKQEVK